MCISDDLRDACESTASNASYHSAGNDCFGGRSEAAGQCADAEEEIAEDEAPSAREDVGQLARQRLAGRVSDQVASSEPGEER